MEFKSETDEKASSRSASEIGRVRGEIAHRYLQGQGLEVGAGARPFPLPAGASALYGDIRDETQLKKFFQTASVKGGDLVNAQTLSSVSDASLDFLIYAHHRALA